MTPYLSNLDLLIETAGTPATQAELLAEKALYLSRLGRAEEANDVISRLRAQYGNGNEPAVLVAIMLAEGVMHYFKNLSEQAYGRVTRAYVLARTLRLTRQYQLAASWLAHLELDRSSYSRMAEVVDEILGMQQPLCLEARCRLNIVLGDSFLMAGDRRQAQKCYSSARIDSSSVGDRVNIGAIMYDRAAFGISRARAVAFADGCAMSASDARMLRKEIESSYEYQRITGVTALDHLSRVYVGQALLICGEYGLAAEFLGPLLQNLEQLEDRVKRTPLRTDLALCLAQTGDTGAAADLLRATDKLAPEDLDVDDQVIALGVLMDLAANFEVGLDASMVRCQFDHARERYRADLLALQAALTMVQPRLQADVADKV